MVDFCHYEFWQKSYSTYYNPALKSPSLFEILRMYTSHIDVVILEVWPRSNVQWSLITTKYYLIRSHIKQHTVTSTITSCSLTNSHEDPKVDPDSRSAQVTSHIEDVCKECWPAGRVVSNESKSKHLGSLVTDEPLVFTWVLALETKEGKSSAWAIYSRLEIFWRNKKCFGWIALHFRVTVK